MKPTKPSDDPKRYTLNSWEAFTEPYIAPAIEEEIAQESAGFRPSCAYQVLGLMNFIEDGFQNLIKTAVSCVLKVHDSCSKT